MRHHRRRPQLVLVVLAALLVGACSGGDGDGDVAAPTTTVEPEPEVAVEGVGDGPIQDLWLLARLRTVHDGELVDLTPTLAEAAADAGEPVELVDGVTMAAVPGLSMELVDVDGTVRDDVAVDIGLLEAEGDQAIVAVATPAPGADQVRGDDELRISLGLVADQLTDGAGLVTDYVFAQTLPSADDDVAAAEDDLASLDLLAARLERGALRYLSPEEDGEPLGYLAQIGRIDVPGQPQADPADGPAGGVAGEEGATGGDDGPAAGSGDGDGGGLGDAAEGLSDAVGDGEDGRPADPGGPEAGVQGSPAPGPSSNVVARAAGPGAPGRAAASGAGTGAPGVRLAGDDDGAPTGGIPPKAQPTLNGFADGIWSCRGKAFGTLGCLKDYFEKFGDGAKDSLGQIDDQLGPDPTPAPSCSSSSCGGSSGEPHLRTFDGQRYDLQTAGELVAARTDGLEVQLRTEPYGDSTRVSVNTAVAVGTVEHRITATVGDDEPVRIDGEVVGLDELRGEGIELDDGTRVWVRQRSLQVRDGAGHLVTASGLGARRLNVYVDGAGQDSTWEGVFGDGDGDPADDLTPRDGDAPVDVADQDALYGDFAESWRVTDATSLFDYSGGEGPETFHDRDFPEAPVTVDDLDPTGRAVAELVCEAAAIEDPVSFDACVLDYTLTGELDDVVGARIGATVERVTEGELVPGDLATAIVATDPSQLEWTWQQADRSLQEQRGGELVTGEGLAVVRTEDGDGRAWFTAFELDSGDVRWEVPDTANGCAPVVTPEGVVAQLDRETAAGGEDGSDDLVLLDLQTGEERSRWAPPEDAEDPLRTCEIALSATPDGTVVQVQGRRIVRAVTTDGGTLAPVWSIPLEDVRALGWSPVVDGAPHLLVTAGDPSVVSVWRLDAATGEVADRLELPQLRSFPDHPFSLWPLPGDRLAVLGDPSEGAAPSLTVLEAGGPLAQAWVFEFVEDDDLGPDELTSAPVQVGATEELVAGWTSGAAGRIIAAWALDSGELVWTAEPSSFDNTRNLIEGVDGEGFLLSPFGGNWMELVADGEQVWRIEEIPGLDSPQAIGPVLDGQALVAGPVTGDAGGGTYVGRLDVVR